ncbi:hypothetical protein BKA57DRAFT_454542 [Linnemannia elongata]|nr:hypothetical protein BKA57DRAFT_454542 [Linnemannia elongata]
MTTQTRSSLCLFFSLSLSSNDSLVWAAVIVRSCLASVLFQPANGHSLVFKSATTAFLLYSLSPSLLPIFFSVD